MDSKKETQPEQMSADRLLRAADVLMAARGRGDDSEAFVDAWLGHADAGAPGVDRPFTYEELVEGMCFLIRCGFVDPTQPSRARGADPSRVALRTDEGAFTGLLE